MPFAHLHVHTEYSVLDGLATVPEHVNQAVNLGQTHMAITDHGVLCGLNEFYRTCKKHGVEPVLGEEFYFVPDAKWRPAKGSKERGERYHVVILAKGERGYRTLVELASASHRQFYSKPLLDRPLLESLGSEAENLICLSGCAGSIISQASYRSLDEGSEEIEWWREIFPNFFIEIQDHSTPFDYKLNKRLIKLARKFKVPLVCTNDPHYTLAEDAPHHDALLAIQTASDIDDPNRFRFEGEGFHLRSTKEMRRAFRRYEDQDAILEGMRNSFQIARACETKIPEWESRTWHIPRYPGVKNSYEHLRSLVRKGLKKLGLDTDSDYTLRTEHELGVIQETKIADFLLITLDIITRAKDQGIPVGPGRGSVCGSLVCYVIGIHAVDPVRYGLLFERFLNPARPRMPDIDVDFGKARRLELISYIKERYGEENVVAVCTFARMNTRAAFQQLARAHGIPFAQSIRISKTLSDETEEEGEDGVSQLPDWVLEKYPDLMVQLKRLAGVKRSMGKHPGGVLIGDPKDKIAAMVPQMYIASSKELVGQFDREVVEAMGLMKQDMLGLRALDTVQECLNLILEYRDEEWTLEELYRWWPDHEEHDAKIYRMLAKGDTAGVFQMEGAVNTAGIIAMKCKEFEDIVSCTSLYRTGPIRAGFPKMFHENRKLGQDQIAYAHPLLEPILGSTWGVILYQEQVMNIGRSLANFTMSQVDDIKEAIKHKESHVMVEMRPIFIKGCIDNNVPESAAAQVWSQIEFYSGYSYNRSHAVAYSILSYITARLKLLYPLEFYCALLRTVEASGTAGKYRRMMYLQDIAKRGYRILPPCINRSDTLAIPDYSKKGIRFGFADLKGIGPSQAQKIVQGRSEGPYTDAEQVASAVRNSGVMKALTSSCTMRNIGVKGSPRKAEELLGWAFTDKMAKIRPELKKRIRMPDPRRKECRIAGEIVSITKGKTKNEDPYLTWQVRWSPHEQWQVRLWSDTQPHWHYPRGSVVFVKGRWEEAWNNVSVSGPDDIELIREV